MRALVAFALLCAAACGDDSNPGTDGGSSGDGGGTDDGGMIDGPPLPVACTAPLPFSDGITPTRTITVGAGGDFATIEAAAADATPGTAIRLLPGTHASDQFVGDLRGTATAPIWIGGEPGTAMRPVISGGAQALQLSRPAYVVIHDLEVTGATTNGINIDDGGDVDDEMAAHFVVVMNVNVHDIGTQNGNLDCLKVSGVNDLLVRSSRFANCGGGGSGIDHVGCHRSTIANNVFDGRMATAVQSKGGATDHDIRDNRTRITGERTFNLGGSTGFEFFRPALSETAPNAEARRIRAYDNLIYVPPGGTPFAFVGCVDCIAAHNHVRGPYQRHFRILQETTTQAPYTFLPASNGLVANNIFEAEGGTANINVGANTAPETFTYRNNLWSPAVPAMGQFVGGTVMDQYAGDPSVTFPDDPTTPFTTMCPAAPELGMGADLMPGLGRHHEDCRLGALISIGPWEACPI